ncbi:hypothetical protein VJV57_26165 [Escherichia coli]|jgi:hypothetical protein|uniref:HofO family protein n=1 Tax=Escherichia coli TaxID=562 RepID=UPI002DBB6AA0|nr:hypothetical protein [Escherichia coli]MEC4256698.1 hypothetical protein [Escherichia coli]
MNEWIQRWLNLSTLPRYILLMAAALSLLLICWIAILRPLKVAQSALLLSLEQQQHSLQRRQHQLAQNPSLETLQQQWVQASAQLRSASSAPALEALLAARGQQLEQWQPDAQPRALTLHLQWAQFQPLFAEMAKSSAPFPQRFQLAMQQTHLVAELWLEHEDAP